MTEENKDLTTQEKGAVSTADAFTDPGIPPHVHRLADDDDKAAKRAELQVVILFLISILASILFVVCYFTIPMDAVVSMPLIGSMSALHAGIGVSMAFSLAGIGFGAVHWAKTLMPDHEIVEERHDLRSDDETREAAKAVVGLGAEEAGLSRRPLIKYTLGGALGLFAVPVALPLIAGLGPLPGNDLSTTMWDTKLKGKARRLVRDPDGTPIRMDEVTTGSVFHVLPEGFNDADVKHPLNEKAKSSVILVRLEEEKIASTKERDWGIDGIVAYSKICTHVGCPVGLYEQQTHHLLCPCHQSTFDMTNDCEVIFGPAKRPLPQLKIEVDDEGYLYAPHGFTEVVGPTFWEDA